jgi:hypothetical protein
MTKNEKAPEESKLRDKLAEIIDAVGIDKDILKAKDKMKAVDGKTIKGSAYAVPENSINFLAEVILKYTSTDFKLLRQAEFLDMSVEEMQFLIDGFIRFLIGRGYSNDEMIKQHNLMDRRLHYKVRLSERALDEVLAKTKELAREYETNEINFNYDDRVYFVRYMACSIEATNNHISAVQSAYVDTRSDEISDMAFEECNKETPYESNVRISKEMQFLDTLEKDAEYQKLLREQEKIVAERDFVKLKQGRYNKNAEKMEQIRIEHQIELFGERLPEEDNSPIIVKHPMDVLREAVEFVEENRTDNIKREIKEVNKTPEDIEKEKQQWEAVREFLESKGHRFDLPNTDNEEEEIFVTSNLAYKVKGMIKFPCCKKEKIIVYEGAEGRSSNKCPRCGKYALFDFDKMTSEPAEVARGVSHKFKIE